MRTEEEIITTVLQVAVANEHIRAVLLTGSRANANIKRDSLQDFDIIYIVTQIDTFTSDQCWIDVFGERLIMQLPDEMLIGTKDPHVFHYLMLFTDGNRIDLTLYPLNKLNCLLQEESPLKVLMDKENSIQVPPATEKKYLIKPPTEKEFKDCCNEFWWVSTYVAKGLWRKEVVYARDMLEGPVRAMFFQMIEWTIGVRTSFTVTFGKSGRNMQQQLPARFYDKILATYPDGNIENIWKALFLMAELFGDIANEVAKTMQFYYDAKEANNVKNYLESIHVMP